MTDYLIWAHSLSYLLRFIWHRLTHFKDRFIVYT